MTTSSEALNRRWKRVPPGRSTPSLTARPPAPAPAPAAHTSSRASGIPGGPGATGKLPGAGVSCVYFLSKQLFDLSALGKMINIISLTFSKFDVDRGISARASCRLAGPDGAALPLFAVSALPLSDPAVLVSATSQGGTEGDAGISWKERSPTNLGPAGGLALCSSWPQYRCPALGRDFILQKSVHTSPPAGSPPCLLVLGPVSFCL